MRSLFNAHPNTQPSCARTTRRCMALALTATTTLTAVAAIADMPAMPIAPTVDAPTVDTTPSTNAVPAPPSATASTLRPVAGVAAQPTLRPVAGVAAQRVSVPAGSLTLPALWWPADGPNDATQLKRPAIIALHGCGGLITARGTVQQRYLDYAARWHQAGWHVLAPDSFTPRGRRQICTEHNAIRTIKVRLRRDDVVAAFAWLAARPDVDATRIALVGWSNGGSTLLEALDVTAWQGEATAGAHPVMAVAFYPGCRAVLARPGYAPVVPLQMLLGADDDWTPPQPCEALVRTINQRAPQLPWRSVTYAHSVHGFDSHEPVRLRTDVPNGSTVGAKRGEPRAEQQEATQEAPQEAPQGAPQGVHQGGNPVAREQALRVLDATLRAAFQ